MPAAMMPDTVAKLCAATDGIFNLNFITLFTDDSHIAQCEALRPAVVSFHWGHPPAAWIERLQRAGIKVWEQVGSVAAAQKAVADNIDLLIVQGSEAGGHNLGRLPLFVLLPEIIDAVAPTLVLAAGGIADGRGVAAALALGADGVWVGTRMAASREADLAAGYKQRLVAARGEDAVLSSLFGRDTASFNPMRVLRNRIVAEWEGREHSAPDDPSNQERLGEMMLGGMQVPLHRFSNLVPMSTATGDLEQMPLLAGQGVGLVDSIAPAAEVMQAMMSEARDILFDLGLMTT
jgi:enoyl-[acyl-carrier protein] reductase II